MCAPLFNHRTLENYLTTCSNTEKNKIFEKIMSFVELYIYGNIGLNMRLLIHFLSLPLSGPPS